MKPREVSAHHHSLLLGNKACERVLRAASFVTELAVYAWGWIYDGGASGVIWRAYDGECIYDRGYIYGGECTYDRVCLKGFTAGVHMTGCAWDVCMCVSMPGAGAARCCQTCAA